MPELPLTLQCDLSGTHDCGVGQGIRWLDQKIAIAGAMSQGGEIGEPGDRRLFRRGIAGAERRVGARQQAKQCEREGEVGACSSLLN